VKCASAIVEATRLAAVIFNYNGAVCYFLHGSSESYPAERKVA